MFLQNRNRHKNQYMKNHPPDSHRYLNKSIYYSGNLNRSDYIQLFHPYYKFEYQLNESIKCHIYSKAIDS